MAKGDSTDAQCAAFLMALCMKGEADEELMAFIDVYRGYSLNYHALPNSLNSAGPTEGRTTFSDYTASQSTACFSGFHTGAAWR